MSPPQRLGLDWIAHVEACYDLAASQPEWLSRLAATAAPLVPRSGFAVIAFDFAATPTTFRLGDIGVHGPPELAEDVRRANGAVSEAEADLLYRGGMPGGTLSTTLFLRHPEARQPFLDQSGGRVRDVMGWAGHTCLGSGVMLNTPCGEETVLTPAEARRWSRLTAHMASGLRLRQRLAGTDPRDAPAEAVFDGGGRLFDASGPARAEGVRERLRAAVRAVDRARTAAGREEADVALAAWQGLLEGRWSLVDRFDSDGRRFVVALRNDPEHPDPRGLSQRERQVAELVGLGQATKQIAYALGTTPSSVENSAARAIRKLGLANRAELAGFFSAAGVRAKLAEVAVEGERLLVGAWPLADEARLAVLSEAEREIAALLLQGFANAAIAERRSTSAHTIGAQVSSIYRKLGVRSRGEFGASLQAAPAPAE